MRILRVLLALLLVAGPVRAQPVVDLLSRYTVPADEAAAAAPEGDASQGSGKKLADLEANLALVSESLEGFAHPQDADKALLAAKPRLPAGTAPFFRDRTTALNALYRTLAVVDYTWALRFPDPPCSPADKRAVLLRSEDGLFLDPETGKTSVWMAALLGPNAQGKSLETALDQASVASAPSETEYARLRARLNLITKALDSQDAVGAARAKLYCKRAETRMRLAFANRDSGPVLAGRIAKEEVTRQGLVIIAGRTAKDLEVRGAGVVIETKAGIRVLTDHRLGGGAVVALVDRNPDPVPLSVEREDDKSGLLLLRPDGDLGKALTLAEVAPSKDDLVIAFAHSERLGAWTRSQGLVTKVDRDWFLTDAVAEASMAGGAVLDAEGRVAGLLVLRRVEGDSREWPAAVPAPALRAWINGGSAPASGRVVLSDAGTTKILTASRPLLESLAAGQGAIVASADSFTQRTAWGSTTRAVCVANCDDGNSGSSYPGGNGSAELGQALGKLVAMGVQALIFKGIPALFRGLGSLSPPRPALSIPSIVQSSPVVAQKEKPPEPPRIRCAFGKVDEPARVGTEVVTLKVRFSCDDQVSERKVPREGHTATFTLGWEGETPQFEKIEVPTDAQGFASISFQIKNTQTNAERSFNSLDANDPDKKRPVDQAFIGVPSVVTAPGEVFLLRGVGTKVSSVVRLSLKGGALIPEGGTLGEVVVAGGAASIGIIIAGGAVVVFTVNYGLNEMISAQEKFNEAIDVRNPLQDKFEMLAKEAAKSRKPKEDCALGAGEDVIDRFVDGTRLSAGFLNLHEAPVLGHTLAKHVGKKREISSQSNSL